MVAPHLLLQALELLVYCELMPLERGVGVYDLRKRPLVRADGLTCILDLGRASHEKDEGRAAVGDIVSKVPKF